MLAAIWLGAAPLQGAVQFIRTPPSAVTQSTVGVSAFRNRTDVQPFGVRVISQRI
jgi:O-antigen ligase